MKGTKAKQMMKRANVNQLNFDHQKREKQWSSEIWAILRETAEMHKEHDLWMKEHNLWMKEHDRQMKEHDRQMKEHDRQMKEHDLRMKEHDLQMKETDRQIKETSRLMEETRQQSKETDLKIKELSTRFGSTTGHIIEGLMGPAAFKMLQDAGYAVNRCCKKLKRKNKNPLLAMEIDELLVDETIAIAVEVKVSCDNNDINRFLKKMERFKELFYEYKDKDVLVAIAAINYEGEADRYAHQCGLLVIRVNENDTFTLDSSEGDTLKKF